MTDVLDRLGRQLQAAEHALFLATAPARAPRRWRQRRSALMAGVAVLLGGSALAAATQPWNPVSGTVASTSTAAPPRSELARLAVLRRPQDAEDRGPLASALLRRLVGEQDVVVRLGYVRLLTATNGRRALLVPMVRVRSPGGHSPNLCLIVGDVGFGHANRSGSDFCENAGTLRYSGLTASSGGDVFGVVPDGVARVVLRYADGQTLSSAVRSNFFWISGGATSQSPIGAISSPHSTHWLNRAGQTIGPPS